MQTNEVIPAEEIKVVQTKIDGMRESVEAVEVKSEDDLKVVAGHIGNVKKMKKYVEQERDKYIKPAKEIIQTAKDKYDPYVKACEEAEKILKGKAEAFMLAENKKIEEAKAKEIAKVESGYQKPETAVKKLENIGEAKKKVDGGDSTLSMKMVKDYRIIDEKKIPEEYYKPRELDLAKIRKVVLAGVAIPGVEVFEKPQMASR